MTCATGHFRVLSLNCCGLKTRLQYPEYEELLIENDIVCLVETKTDDIDLIEFQGYKFYMKNRRKVMNKRSGGIIVGYKEELDCHLKFLCTNSKYVLWFECDKKLFNTDQPVIFGVVYIPPEYTKYSSDEAFTEIENEFLELSNKTKCICLMGDFNPKTANDPDFVKLETTNHNICDISEFVQDNTCLLDFLNMTIERKSMDSSKNRYGNLLLNFCKGNGVFILNGRAFGDKNIGKFTCRNASVVDYCICTPDILFSVCSFNILETSKLYSDVHTPISISFTSSNVNQNVEHTEGHDNESKKVKIKHWDSSKTTEYQTNIDRLKLLELEQKLINYRNELNIDIQTVDTLLDDLNHIYVTSASQTFGTYTIKDKSKSKDNENKNKPWFDQDCKNARQSYRKSKRHYKANNSEQNRHNMIQLEKDYKEVMDDKYKLYCKKLSDEAHNASSDDPKRFWKMLGSHKRKRQPNIDIDSLYDFFKDLNSNNVIDNVDDFINENNAEQNINEHINGPITQDEIKLCIKNLKNEKACSDDEIINEYIKSTSELFLKIYESLFNIVFDNGVLPNCWLSGTIKPIYKNKGDQNNPKNYRPITIVSCLGKLFTAILNKRLNDFSDNFEILKENQTGFRKSYSTLDNVFSIYSVFQLLKIKKKKLFCAFIDFEKAFDKVWRNGLFHKLLNNSINGKMYNVILNMYKNIKSCISYNNSTSDYFPCEVGVRQGENLSPFLFALFLNDLEAFFIDKGIDDLSSISHEIESELDIFIKIFMLLYADDTALLAESATDLQDKLNAFEEYCELWKLKVNVDKTKIMVFGSGRNNANYQFIYGGSIISIVKDFEYLGITFSKTFNFDLTKKRLSEKALRAMYELLKMGRLYKLSIKLQLELFDKMIKPILLYGSEIWGFGKNDILERIQLKFYKILLNLKSSTPNYMVYGETGRMPIDIDIKIRCICFWYKLVCGKQSKISSVVYRLSKKLYDRGNTSIKLLHFIKSILDDCGCSFLWNTDMLPAQDELKVFLKQRLSDQFKQFWQSCITDSAKSLNYRIFKTFHEFENYLNILTIKEGILFCRFRTTNNYLPIETGRWRNIERENRHCHLCNSGELGDEYHYILECSILNEQRKRLLPNYYINRPNTLKFSTLMSTKKPSLLKKLCKFIKIINSSVSAPG